MSIDASSVRTAEEGGRLAAVLYTLVGLSILGSTAAAGRPVDALVIAFTATCLGAGISGALLPWRRYPRALTGGVSLSATVTMLLFVPIAVHNPVYLLLPAVAALWTGTVLSWPWVVGQQVLVCIGFGLRLAGELGTRSAWATAGGVAALALCIGLAAVWMRSRVEQANGVAMAAAADDAERTAAALREREAFAVTLSRTVDDVAAASSSVRDQSSYIAAATEELAESVRHISHSADQTNHTVRDVAAAAARSRELVVELDDSGQRIISVVDAIAALSAQTNLLALNATIEAARAGDAGRGCAGVASGGKDLAQQTAQSAAEITSIVSQVHAAVAESTQAMTRISEMVDGLQSEQSELASAIEQQASAVEQIARSSAGESDSVTAIASAIAELERQARSSGH